jgi:hypothetical protein
MFGGRFAGHHTRGGPVPRLELIYFRGVIHTANFGVTGTAIFNEFVI